MVPGREQIVAADNKSQGSGWRNGMIVVPLAFAVMILGMVVAAQFQRTDLVAPNYYDRGIQYQQQIDRMIRRDSLQARVGCSYEADVQQIKLQFPSSYAAGVITGTIQLFRPSDAALDRMIPIDADITGSQVVDMHDYAMGRWKLFIQWQADTLQFFQEYAFYRE